MAAMFLLILESYLRVISILILLSGCILPVTVGLFSVLMPSARVVNAVLESAHVRLSVLLIKSPFGFAGAFVSSIILIATLGFSNAADAIFVLENPFADTITVLLFYLWMAHGSLSTAGFDLLTGGFEKTDVEDLEARNTRMALLSLPLIGMVNWIMPGPYGSFGILTVMFVIFVNTRFALREIARLRRSRAPRALDRASESNLGTSLILQISDVHATAERSKRTDGGPDGTASLDALTKTILHSKAPQLVLMTGDIIDRGTQDEWAGVLPLMHQLRKAGCRVLITPGNHDLATAYQPGIAERFGGLATGTIRAVDARKIITLLEHTAEIEPAVRTNDGQLLSEFICEVRRPVTALETAWHTAREQALSILRKDPGVPVGVMRSLEKQGPKQVFFHLGISSPGDVRLIMDNIMEHAERIFRPGLEPLETAERAIVKWLFRRDGWDLPVTLLGRYWMNLWYRPFPLQLVVEPGRIEFLILNSNAPEPGLLGSAFGRLGNDQIERLRTAVSGTLSRTLVVLMHHSVCGWNTERGDQPDSFRISAQRWAMLAHDSVEAIALTQLLETAAPATCRQIFLCSGHRHDVSRAGPVQHATGSASSRLWILESASLPDLFNPKWKLRNNNGLLALSSGDRGEFHVGRIAWNGWE